MSGLRPCVCGLFALALVAAGCGGGSATYPRAAEPADSPPLGTRPAGTVAPLRRMPQGMVFVPGAGLLAVVVRDPDQLVFLDPESLAVVRRVALPASARHLALSASGDAVVVPAEAADELLTVSPRGGVLTHTAVGKHPHDAAVAAGSIFVADEHSDQVSVVRGGRDVADLDAPVQPGGIAAVGDRFIALIAVGQRVLRVYDARTDEALGEASAGVGPTHIVSLGEDAYVADTEGGVVREFRIGAEPRQVASVPAPGAPYGIAADPRRHRLWVSLTASNRLAEFEVGGPRPRRLATFSTVRQPDSVAVDSRTGTVFVTGTAAGQIERIVPGSGGGR